MKNKPTKSEIHAQAILAEQMIMAGVEFAVFVDAHGDQRPIGYDEWNWWCRTPLPVGCCIVAVPDHWRMAPEGWRCVKARRRPPWHRRRYGGTPLWQWLVLAAMILAMEAYLCR